MATPYQEGDVLAGKYRVEGVLSDEGGMGDVLDVTETCLGRRVALKVMKKELGPEAAKRFRQEAQAVAAIKHPNVVTIFTQGELEDGTPFIEMELLEGHDLAWVLEHEQERRFTAELAVRYVRQACAGLAEAHKLGIVHRDVKTSNLFRAEGKDGEHQIKVIDFGLVKDLARSPIAPALTAPKAFLGTPYYMSPEQFNNGEVSPASDVWALGIVLYELVTGKKPFDGSDTIEIAFWVGKGHPKRPSTLVGDLPAALEDVILRCLESDPSKRYASARELGDDLAADRLRVGDPVDPVGAVAHAEGSAVGGRPLLGHLPEELAGEGHLPVLTDPVHQLGPQRAHALAEFMPALEPSDTKPQISGAPREQTAGSAPPAVRPLWNIGVRIGVIVGFFLAGAGVGATISSLREFTYDTAAVFPEFGLGKINPNLSSAYLDSYSFESCVDCFGGATKFLRIKVKERTGFAGVEFVSARDAVDLGEPDITAKVSARPQGWIEIAVHDAGGEGAYFRCEARPEGSLVTLPAVNKKGVHHHRIKSFSVSASYDAHSPERVTIEVRGVHSGKEASAQECVYIENRTEPSPPASVPTPSTLPAATAIVR